MDYFGFSKEFKMDKFLPKELIYKQIDAKEVTKKLFVDNIEKIKIRSSIKEEGSNIKTYRELESKEVYEEILFLKIELKKKGKEEKIVDIFHKIFPRQTVLELKYDDLTYLSCANKKIGKNLQTIEKIYNTGWFKEEKEKEFIESLNYRNYDLTNLKTFYESIEERIRLYAEIKESKEKINIKNIVGNKLFLEKLEAINEKINILKNQRKKETQIKQVAEIQEKLLELILERRNLVK